MSTLDQNQLSDAGVHAAAHSYFVALQDPNAKKMAALFGGLQAAA